MAGLASLTRIERGYFGAQWEERPNKDAKGPVVRFIIRGVQFKNIYIFICLFERTIQRGKDRN